ncbi:MAG: hypothetical protein ACWA40_10380 [Planktomarina sp.]
MKAPVSSKPLFQAMKPKRDDGALLPLDLPRADKPREHRDPLDYDPTPPTATAAFLSAEGARMREIGGPVWEPAVGGGHMAKVLLDHGFDVIGSDIVDRGWPGTDLVSFYDVAKAPADIIVTNPPYGEINARDGHGRWLRHTMSCGPRYVAMLLNWDWPAARQNGLDELHRLYPMSRVYLCCWKIDFRGGGSPPQRNAWIVWDRDWTGETVMRRLFKDVPDQNQGALL